MDRLLSKPIKISNGACSLMMRRYLLQSNEANFVHLNAGIKSSDLHAFHQSIQYHTVVKTFGTVTVGSGAEVSVRNLLFRVLR